MSGWNVVLALVLLYLLAGSASAYVNFHTAEERKSLVEKLNGLRRSAFQKGINLQLRISDNVQEIGLDEDTAVRNSPALRSSKLAFLSVGSVRILVALAFMLMGPLPLRYVFAERRRLRELRLAYEQAAEIYEVCLENHDSGAV